MRTMMLATACALALAVGGVSTAAHAQSAAQKEQQGKMASCNADAKTKKLEGDARKKFMSECLSADKKGPSAAQKAQQDKMKSCNADAKAKKVEGDARKKFMSECLKG